VEFWVEMWLDWIGWVCGDGGRGGGGERGRGKGKGEGEGEGERGVDGCWEGLCFVEKAGDVYMN